MREKVRKSILTFAGLALAVLIMLNPATAKKAMALTPVTPLTVNKPSDIYENIGKNQGSCILLKGELSITVLR